MLDERLNSRQTVTEQLQCKRRLENGELPNPKRPHIDIYIPREGSCAYALLITLGIAHFEVVVLFYSSIERASEITLSTF